MRPRPEVPDNVPLLEVLNMKVKYINSTTLKTALSMNVTSLYPSIKFERAGFIVRKAVEKTVITFENVNWKMATRYISKSAKSQDEVKAWGMEEFWPRRSNSRG